MRPPNGPPGWWSAWKVAVAAGIVLAAAFVLVVASLPPPTPGASPISPGAVVHAVVEGPAGPPVDLAAGFLGVNVRADGGLLGSTAASEINATAVRLVRWPGGGLADRLDPLGDSEQGVIYANDGTAGPAPVALSEFVDWCARISCRSILTLPAEIDRPAYAAQIVSYVENDLHFHPTYWEIGNEPGRWDHFGIPWSNWTAGQNLTVTPVGYAHVVQSYVASIRAVDPTAAIIGLGGVGTSGSGEATWIRDTVARNGPNLSAVALHVYPGGALTGVRSVAGWMATLRGNSSLAHRVPVDLAAIRKGCAYCHIALLVDEFGAATNVTGSDGLSGGYLATYLAALLTQALPLPITSLDYFVFQLGTYGAWFDIAGTPSPSYGLYTGLDRYLGSFAAPYNVSAPLPGLLGAGGGSTPGNFPNLLLVNTNASVTFSVDLARSYPNATRGIAWLWAGPNAAPIVAPIGAVGAAGFLLPPASVVIFSGIGEPDPPTLVEQAVGSAPAAPTPDLSGPVELPASAAGFISAPLPPERRGPGRIPVRSVGEVRKQRRSGSPLRVDHSGAVLNEALGDDFLLRR
ncbi:MAG: hypothetical protein ACYDFT_03480 [Thermoplasmata archaeon]